MSTSALLEVKDCYYCSDNHIAPLYVGVHDRLAVSGKSWSFMGCDNCGAALLSPYPDAQEIEGFYPLHYNFSLDNSDSRLRRYIAALEYTLHFRWIYYHQAKKTMQLIGQTVGNGLRLLDIGCGNGLFLRELQKLGFDVEGVDLRKEAIDHVRTAWGISAQVMPADQVAAHYPPESFDVITAFHILEHVTNPLEHMLQCRTLLKPGGVLILGLPFIDSLQARLFGANFHIVTEAPRHVSVPSQRAVHMLCARAQFEKVTIIADSALHHATYIGLSLFPKGATTYQYSQTRKWSIGLSRILMAMTVYWMLPFLWVSKHILRHPSVGIVAALKPR